MSALNNLGKKRFEDLPPDARYTKVLETARQVDDKAADSQAEKGQGNDE